MLRCTMNHGCARCHPLQPEIQCSTISYESVLLQNRPTTILSTKATASVTDGVTFTMDGLIDGWMTGSSWKQIQVCRTYNLEIHEGKYDGKK